MENPVPLPYVAKSGKNIYPTDDPAVPTTLHKTASSSSNVSNSSNTSVTRNESLSKKDPLLSVSNSQLRDEFTTKTPSPTQPTARSKRESLVSFILCVL